MIIVISTNDGKVMEVRTDIDGFTAEIVYTNDLEEMDPTWSTLKDGITGKSLAILVVGMDVKNIVSGYHVDTTIHVFGEGASSCCKTSEKHKELLDTAPYIAYTR